MICDGLKPPAFQEARTMDVLLSVPVKRAFLGGFPSRCFWGLRPGHGFLHLCASQAAC